ncbi:MAG: hypothetical protein ACRDVG_15405, partial [Jatrophihabitantaceae bacterium]
VRMVLEQRWTGVEPDQYAAESALVGPAANFDVPESSPGVAVLRPGRGAGEDEVELLSDMRASDTDEPLWSGVSDLRAENGKVRVQFEQRHEPKLLPIEDSSVQVSCHRYDETLADRAR